MCVEPGLGSELGRQLGVAWETTEEESCSTRLPRDRWLVVPEVSLSRGPQPHIHFAGVSQTPMRQTEKLRYGGVACLTHRHTEGLWGETEDTARALPLNPGFCLLELQARNTQPGGVLVVSRPGLPP